MKYVFLAVFLVSTAVHLYASLRKDTRLRNMTKPFILLSLLGFYVLAARSVSAAVVLALLFSWLGDVLLIPKGIKWFTAGGIAFMISHAFFVAAYTKDVVFSRIPVFLIVLLAVFFAAAVAFIFSKLKPHLPKALFYLGRDPHHGDWRGSVLRIRYRAVFRPLQEGQPSENAFPRHAHVLHRRASDRIGTHIKKKNGGSA